MIDNSAGHSFSVWGKLQLQNRKLSRIFLMQLGKELAETSKRILSNPSTTTFFSAQVSKWEE